MKRQSVYWPKAGIAEFHESEMRAPKENEVLIHTQYSLVSQSKEREWLENDHAHVVIGTTFPFIPGYSSAGEVLEVGENVTRFKKGDKVIGAPVYGAHSNLTYVDEGAVYSVPDNVVLDDAVFYNLGMTALYSLRMADIHLGQSIALIGQGVVGQLATQAAKASGYSPIVVFDIQEDRRKKALANGADYAFDPSDQAAIDEFLKTSGELDAVIDMSGSNAGMNQALHLAKPLGTVVFCSGNNDPQLLNYGEIFIKCLTVKGSFVNMQMDLQKQCIHEFLHLLSTGQVVAPEHADTIYSPTDETIKTIYGRILKKDRTLNNPIFKWFD
ncbi:zinc-dependent alcohol dehydrogenase [Secundilactobacillus muriivasis]